MGLADYLEGILNKTQYPVTFAAHEPRSLSRWLVRSAVKDVSAGWGGEPYLDEGARILLEGEAAVLPVDIQENHWRYYVSLSPNFQDPCLPASMFTPGPDKFLYALCNLYAREEQEVLLNAVTYLASPLRLWINGEPAVSASHDFVLKDTLIRVRLRKGNNVVLAELPLDLRYPLTAHEFIVRLQPVDRLLGGEETYDFLDQGRIERMRSALTIIPEKVFIHPGEPVRFLVLPRYVGAGAGGAVWARLESMDGQALAVVETECSRPAEITIPDGVKGTIRFTAGRVDGSGFSAPVHLFSGDFAAESLTLLTEAGRRRDIRGEVLTSVQGMMEEPALFGELHQYVLYEVWDDILRLWGEFRSFLDRPEAAEPKGFTEIFPSGYIFHRPKQAGDDHLIARVHLPQHFDPVQAYPLVLFLADRFGRHYPAELPWIREMPLEHAIVVNLMGIGRLNYIDDLELVRAISDIVSGLPVDRGRIYALGFCTGAMKAFRLGMTMPDLFAGIASVSGDFRLNVQQPEYEWLDNLGDTPVIGLYNYEDWFFNTSRTIASLKRLKNARFRLYTGFMHTELHTLNSSRQLIGALTVSEKERYPRQIRFRVLDPAFLKSHWILSEPSEKSEPLPRIEAEIVAPDEIRISVEYTAGVQLLLSREDMKLTSSIRIFVNGRAATVTIGPYTRVKLRISAGQLTAEAEPITEPAFREAYDAIRADDQLLGIKRIYLRPCTVAVPAARSGFTRKLAYLLQNPIRERYVYYKYDSCSEDELTPERMRGRNYVFIVDAREMSRLQRSLTEAAGVAPEPAGLLWKGRTYPGNYFALLTMQNPWDPANLLLLALFNNDSLHDEMIRLLNGFDTDPRFHEEALIYHNGSCHVIRSREENTISLGGNV
jgi:hypothetical protein